MYSITLGESICPLVCVFESLVKSLSVVIPFGILCNVSAYTLLKALV